MCQGSERTDPNIQENAPQRKSEIVENQGEEFNTECILLRGNQRAKKGDR